MNSIPTVALWLVTKLFQMIYASCCPGRLAVVKKKEESKRSNFPASSVVLCIHDILTLHRKTTVHFLKLHIHMESYLHFPKLWNNTISPDFCFFLIMNRVYHCFYVFSLKKGRIFSITHTIPEDSPFASYEDLRKHWKLMVGAQRRSFKDSI